MKMDIARTTIQRLRPAIAGLLAALMSAACGDVVGPRDEPMDQLLFLSSRDGAKDGTQELFEIYRMNADGSGVENLTHYPTSYGIIASKDGRTVLVSAVRPRLSSFTHQTCPSQLWSLAPNGLLKQITHPPGCSGYPILSPDATQYAAGDTEFYVANADGTGKRPVPYALPPVTQSCSATEPPKWHVRLTGWAAPSRLMFYRYICGSGYTYYSVNLDGSDLRVLDFDVQTARLSPDGTRIVFNRAGNVWLRNVDGSGERVVLQGASVGAADPWSPDGKRIYFTKTGGGGIANVDGDPAIVNLALPQVHYAEYNGWSPRGDRLAFTLYKRTSETEFTYVLDIYVVNSDGTGGMTLTDGTSTNRSAVWMRGR